MLVDGGGSTSAVSFAACVGGLDCGHGLVKASRALLFCRSRTAQVCSMLTIFHRLQVSLSRRLETPT